RLRPSPRADRYTLVRRLYLDLIGLPPTPAEADAFVHDPAPDAYEKLVDHLLASPHYGERWARRWLDLARYADTNGYEKDRPRSIWPYRDWVIRALNRDMPFDEFTIEQLAGDLLPQATADQRIATGFHRNTMLNEEGGIDPLEFRYYSVIDRINTTGTVWLGLTVRCAQCHTHKFDPIPQREYYQMMAFFNNADEPTMPVPDTTVTTHRARLQKQMKAVQATLRQRYEREHLQPKFEAWLHEQSARAVRWTILRPAKATSTVPVLRVLPDNSILSSGDQSKRDTYHVQLSTDLRGITALRLEVLPDDSLPHRGPGRVYYEGSPGDFFLAELTVKANGRPVRLAHASNSYAHGNNTAAHAIDGNDETGWSIAGGEGKAHAAVFNFAKPLTDAHALDVEMLFERYYASDLGRFRISVTTDPRRVEASPLPADVEALLLVRADKRTAAQRARLLDSWLSVAHELAGERAIVERIRRQLPASPTTLVMQERPADETRPTYIHRRGEYLQKTERVQPGVLSILPPLPKSAPPNRLTFARWLVSPDNPLVARVTVNRAWADFFGRGIVPTLGDFGYTGDPPTHPALLDWLAVDFMKEGWSLKKLHRLIVLSATYQQASKVTPEQLAKDPQNVLLSRGPRVRLEAELVRDAALTSSGLLSHKIGGPSVFPPQPPGVTSEGTYGPLAWNVSHGADRHRRGLYTFMKRTAPYAMFVAFDAPSGEECVARRDVSDTPLQSLTLLNDVVFVEAAQALGRLTATRPGTIEARASWLFRRCLSRPPDHEELAMLVRFYKTQKQRFETAKRQAAAVAGSGSGDVAERAAWAAVARAVLNLDEMVTKE
ncbi:MAG TPA: DUF1549 and DUF1553 domain-containing protein, partial [Gemmataceae bacterium]|nr:DUF1549 and DUF1553 domain-containing protein [Gemmataceae bacterium]